MQQPNQPTPKMHKVEATKSTKANERKKVNKHTKVNFEGSNKSTISQDSKIQKLQCRVSQGGTVNKMAARVSIVRGMPLCGIRRYLPTYPPTCFDIEV